MSEETDPVNVGNPNEFTIRQLAEIVQRLMKSSGEIVCRPQPFEDDPKQRKPDISKAERVLGWRPAVSLDEGLERTIAYLREECASKAMNASNAL